MTTVKIKVLADAGNTKEVTADVEKSFDGMGSAVTGIFAGLGSQLGSVFGGISDQLNAALDVGKGQDKLAAQLGLSADDAKKYGKVASDLYAGAWGESLDDVNNTLAQVTKNIGEGNDEWLKSTSALTLDFATTFGQDAQGITAAIGTMLNTGVAQSSEEAFDILTKGMQLGADKGGDLLDTFTEYPTLFRELGLNGADAMGLINQGLQAGARNSDVVADGLKEFSIRAKDGSKATGTAFLALGLDAEQMGKDVAAGGESGRAALDKTLDALRAMQDPVARDAAAVGLFGTKAEDLGDALFAMDPESAASGLGEVTGAAQKMSDTLNDNAATTLESYKRQALMGIANILVNQVIPAFQQIQAVVIEGGKWIGEHKELMLALAIGIAVVVVPALIAWAVSAGAAAISMITLAAPVIAAVALIAALAAGVIYAYEHWGWFHAAVDAVASFMENVLWPALKDIAGWITGTLIPVIADVIGWFVNAGQSVWNVATSVYGAIEWIIGFLVGVGSRIWGFGASMWDGLIGTFKNAINKIIEIWNRFDLSIPGIQLPGFLGGGGWGGIGDIVPDIPYLDTGGLIRKQTLAMVHPDEAVVPLPANWRNGGMGGNTVIIQTLTDNPRRLGRVVRRATNQDSLSRTRVGTGRIR